MLDGQRCQVGIGNKAGSVARLGEKRFEHSRMVFGGLGNPDRLEAEPLFDVIPRAAQAKGPFETSRMIVDLGSPA